MDLRTGKTVWRLKNGPPQDALPLSKDIACDVVIVGGGISGALISYELAKSGLECVILDKREPGAGSTSASTALLLYELDTPLYKLAEMIGVGEAVGCYRASFDALQRLDEVVRELRGKRREACEFRPRKSFYFADRKADVNLIHHEFEMRKNHGFRVNLIEEERIASLFSFSKPAALVTPDAAEVDVVRFTDALLKTSLQRGLRIFGGTEMAGYTARRGKISLRTDTGHTVSARHLVFATGYESEKYLGRKIGTLASSYAIATEPLKSFPGWHARSFIWTTARPYLYLRTTFDNRAIIGGGDIPFKNEKIRDALLPYKMFRLSQKLQALFPKLKFKTACAWTGTFGETPDSLARIGSQPGRPNVHFALGYGGNGITYSMLAADIIREACHGRKHPAARLFRLDR